MAAALALAIGFLSVAAAGVLHNAVLFGIGRIAPRAERRPHGRILVAFLALLLLHLAEILALAALNRALLARPWLAGTDPPVLDWADTVYLTGVNFTTLGYTSIDLAGPVRLVTMAQALGGFMLLTWSATWLYSICEASWRKARRD